jgi:dipeptidyl aminopeptidase/acylaminoacyl peptidase
MTREYFELEPGTPQSPQGKLTPLFGQNEKEEYEALYSGTPGELIVRASKFGEVRRLHRVVIKELKGAPLEAAQAKAVTPESKFDVASFSIDHPKRNLYWTLNEGGYTRAHVFDAKTYVEKPLPKLEGEDHVTFGVASWDGRYVPINASAARHPTVSSVWDWQEKKLVQWVVPSTPEIDAQKFAVPVLEHYTARDGTKIPMFVRRPSADACKPSPCPVVVHFHGGPEGQAVSGMNTYGQIFVDAGFIWIEPNVRGSDGYGRTWLHADDGAKRLSVITDIEDAAKHVRSAFPGVKVGVFGGSYGGYSTLVAMTRFAGAFDAGVANVGMSNLLTFLLNTAPYRRALRISEYGDPEKDKATLLALSPITHIDKLNAPLMLIQGASDPRVPIGEALQMHAALEKRGQKTKMIVFPDEGHGTQKRENKVLEIGHTLDFFEHHLKGKKH